LIASDSKSKDLTLGRHEDLTLGRHVRRTCQPTVPFFVTSHELSKVKI